MPCMTIVQAGMAGLRFADVSAAIAMVGGMFLVGAYRDRAKQEIAARNMANASVQQAQHLKNAPRVRYDSLAGSSDPQA